MKFEKGSIVSVDLNPVKGHEQGNFRPVMVINSVPLPGGVNVVLPITSHQKSYPLEVVLDERTKHRVLFYAFRFAQLISTEEMLSSSRMLRRIL